MAGSQKKTRERSEAKTTPQVPGIKKVQPEIPRDQDELEQLRRDLKRMGCDGLLEVPWAYSDEELVREVIGPFPNVWDNTIRGQPKSWTPELWRETYEFSRGEMKAADRIEEYLSGEFKTTADPKDGYVLRDLKDPDARRVIGFLNPILHPEKPKRIIRALAATILGSYRGKVTVDWAHLIDDTIDKLVKNVRSSKTKSGSPLSTYLAHLYFKQELLRSDEQKDYEDSLAVQQYGGLESGEDSESDSPEPPAPSPAPSPATSSRPQRKNTAKEPAGAEESSRKRKGKGAAPDAEPSGPFKTPRTAGRKTTEAATNLPEEPTLTGEPAGDIMIFCDHIAARTTSLFKHNTKLDGMLRQIAKTIGCVDAEELIPQVQVLMDYPAKNLEMKDEVNKLKFELMDLRTEIRKAEQAKKEAEDRATESAKALAGVRQFLVHPIDVVNKARLFDAKLDKEEKLSRANVIRFLNDQARKMERTWEQMQTLVANRGPEELS